MAKSKKVRKNIYRRRSKAKGKHYFIRSKRRSNDMSLRFQSYLSQTVWNQVPKILKYSFNLERGASFVLIY